MSKQMKKNEPTSRGLSQKEGKGDKPYSVAAASRRERSRELAQKRRTTYKSIMDDLTQVLPFPRDVVAQLDYNSRLRLTLCFFRLKTLMENGKIDREMNDRKTWSGKCKDVVSYRPALYNIGMLQNLMTEALDGFLLVASSDGTVIYLSESVHHHLGIFQSEHIGISLFDLINEDDIPEVKSTIVQAEAKAMSFISKKSVEISFFCRMKCSRFKESNTVMKSPGFKLVYVSGNIKVIGNEYYIVSIVHPVSPSIMEMRMEANMFVTHYNMELKCIFFDGRLRHLLGYQRSDIEGKIPYTFQHHDDISATLKCTEGIITRGESISGYYRFLCQAGFYVWIQTKGTLMHDSRTGKPSYIMCMNYVISKEDGEKDLQIRQTITSKLKGIQEGSVHSYDPFPLDERAEGRNVNPLPATSWHHKKELPIEYLLVKTENFSPSTDDSPPVVDSSESSSSSSRFDVSMENLSPVNQAISLLKTYKSRNVVQDLPDSTTDLGNQNKRKGSLSSYDSSSQSSLTKNPPSVSSGSETSSSASSNVQDQHYEQPRDYYPDNSQADTGGVPDSSELKTSVPYGFQQHSGQVSPQQVIYPHFDQPLSLPNGHSGHSPLQNQTREEQSSQYMNQSYPVVVNQQPHPQSCPQPLRQYVNTHPQPQHQSDVQCMGQYQQSYQPHPQPHLQQPLNHMQHNGQYISYQQPHPQQPLQHNGSQERLYPDENSRHHCNDQDVPGGQLLQLLSQQLPTQQYMNGSDQSNFSVHPQGNVSGGDFSHDSVPFDGMQMSRGVTVNAIGSLLPNWTTSNSSGENRMLSSGDGNSLTELTGEDLKVLDFIDNFTPLNESNFQQPCDKTTDPTFSNQEYFGSEGDVLVYTESLGGEYCGIMGNQLNANPFIVANSAALNLN